MYSTKDKLFLTFSQFHKNSTKTNTLYDKKQYEELPTV